jgi:hypothetical protein
MTPIRSLVPMRSLETKYREMMLALITRDGFVTIKTFCTETHLHRVMGGLWLRYFEKQGTIVEKTRQGRGGTIIYVLK